MVPIHRDPPQKSPEHRVVRSPRALPGAKKPHSQSSLTSPPWNSLQRAIFITSCKHNVALSRYWLVEANNTLFGSQATLLLHRTLSMSLPLCTHEFLWFLSIHVKCFQNKNNFFKCPKCHINILNFHLKISL